MAWTETTLTTNASEELVNKVLRQYGIVHGDDTELRDVVRDLVDDTIRDYNSHCWEFNKRVKSSLTIVAGTATIELTDTPVYKESLAYLVKSTGEREAPLTYMPYAKFMSSYGDTVFTRGDRPVVYTFRNVENDGLVHLGPTPDSHAAADYTLTVEYYRRIPLIADAYNQDAGSGQPTVEAANTAVAEIEVPLIYGAMKRLAIHLHGPAHPDVSAFDALEQRALKEVMAADKRHPDQQQRFTIADNSRRNYNRRELFIRIQ